MNIKISEKSFRSIEVYKCTYELERNNSGLVRCRDCRGAIAPDLGIYRKAYKRNGYLCFACFSKDVTILTTGIDRKDAGFFIDSLDRLRACTLRRPDLSSVEILEAVYIALLEVAENSIDIFLGVEGAHPYKILDTAEAMIGKR